MQIIIVTCNGGKIKNEDCRQGAKTPGKIAQSRAASGSDMGSSGV
jgi:hypothetical protein